MLERLESRRLLAVSASLTGGILKITGDNESNRIGVGRNELAQIVVRSGAATIGTFPLASVASIAANLLGGNDVIELAGQIEKPSTLVGGEGNDTISGGSGKDSIYGESGNDSLRGNLGSDSISGGIGNDTIDGGLQADAIFGGEGIDVAIYAARTDAVKVSLDNLANDGAPGRAATATEPARPAEGDNVHSDIEKVIGGRGNDTLSGATAGHPVTLDGGLGNDSLFGSTFADSLIGASGNDSLVGNDGNDTLLGGKGADRMAGGGGSDLVSYADRTVGIVVTTYDSLANDGTPERAATATEPARPAEKDNVLPDVERIAGGSGNDKITGSEAANTISGGLGNDSIYGSGGNDIIEGGAGNDVISGGTGDDKLYAGTGEDKLYGNDGNDWLYGRNGDKDTLDGGGGIEDRAQRDALDVVLGIEVFLA